MLKIEGEGWEVRVHTDHTPGRHGLSLCDQHELDDILGRDVRDTGAEVLHRVAQAGNDGLPVGDGDG